LVYQSFGGKDLLPNDFYINKFSGLISLYAGFSVSVISE
jgi:hypothetical protein